ncbi:2-(3-amino-3-carboxypropyl)histidine synthase [uncultured archaeon]|nr:2-(3-amino-3-carboxypropyl)histidine synthase [uncultured archaeon]
MKIVFIPAKINSEIDAKKMQNLKLPVNIAIAYSIQYKDITFKIKEILSKNHKITSITQVLGCSKPKFIRGTEAILLVSSGKFHAISLSAETNLPVYVLEAGGIKKISKEEVDSFAVRKKASYLKFLNAEKIGILVSTKSGQENLKKAISFKNNLKNKKSYLFMGNNINVKEFENFPDIKAWVNSACPRMDFDSSAINISDLEKN